MYRTASHLHCGGNPRDPSLHTEASLWPPVQVLGAQLFIFPQGMPSSSPALGWLGHTLITCPQSAEWAPPSGLPGLMQPPSQTEVQTAPGQPAQVHHPAPHPAPGKPQNSKCIRFLKAGTVYTILWRAPHPPFLHQDMDMGPPNWINVGNIKHTQQFRPGQICHPMGHKRIRVFRAFYKVGELRACDLILCI